ILAPAYATEFEGTTLPPEWSSFPWQAGGAAGVANGRLSVDGARVNTEPESGFVPGISMEFVATFTATPYQHGGFGGGTDLPPGDIFDVNMWAMFSTGGGGAAVLARTTDGSTTSDFPIPGNLLGGPHRYRIDWNAASVAYYVDGALVHTE